MKDEPAGALMIVIRESTPERVRKRGRERGGKKERGEIHNK